MARSHRSTRAVPSTPTHWAPSPRAALEIPDTPLAVFHFLLVTVEGDAITVTPTDALGGTFDRQVLSATR